MITIYNENGLMMQKDGAKLIITDEGYGTVETFVYSDEMVEKIIAEHNDLKAMAD